MTAVRVSAVVTVEVVTAERVAVVEAEVVTAARLAAVVVIAEKTSET